MWRMRRISADTSEQQIVSAFLELPLRILHVAYHHPDGFSRRIRAFLLKSAQSAIK